MKKRADAEIAVVSFRSKNGAQCVGYFDVVGFHPDYAGQWGLMVQGVWAPESQVAYYLPCLIEVWKSFSINREYASEYVRRGIEKHQKAHGTNVLP